MSASRHLDTENDYDNGRPAKYPAMLKPLALLYVHPTLTSSIPLQTPFMHPRSPPPPTPAIAPLTEASPSPPLQPGRSSRSPSMPPLRPHRPPPRPTPTATPTTPLSRVTSPSMPLPRPCRVYTTRRLAMRGSAPTRRRGWSCSHSLLVGRLGSGSTWRSSLMDVSCCVLGWLRRGRELWHRMLGRASRRWS